MCKSAKSYVIKHNNNNNNNISSLQNAHILSSQLDGLAIAIVVSKGWAKVMYTFLTRTFYLQAIAWPIARLVIASFYVYSLLCKALTFSLLHSTHSII